MSQTIKVANFSDRNLGENTALTSNVSSGTTSLLVENSQGFLTDNFVLIGTPGADQSEVVQVSGSPPSQIVITVGMLTLGHNRYESVTKLFGNKIKLYRADNIDGSQPDDDDFDLVSTTTIEFDDIDTTIEDDDGSSSHWYKFTYYNSFTSDETSLSSSSGMRGGGYGNYCTIQMIKERAGLTSNRWVSDTTIDEYRQAAQDEVNGALVGLYTLPFTDPVPFIIQDITARLAAGLLLSSPWAGQFTTTTSEGDTRLKGARSDLLNLQQKMKTIVVNGESIALPNVGGFSMFPDASTDGATVADGGPRFTSGDRY